MTAKLKEIYSIDIDEKFEYFYPENPLLFDIYLTMVIGIDGEEGGELFYINICSLKKLSQEIETTNAIFGRGLLVVKEYDYNLIKSKIKQYIQSCNGNSWSEISNCLSKVFYWEFENYQKTETEGK